MHRRVTRAVGLSTLMVLAGSAAAAAPPLPKRITVTTQNDTTIQYLVPAPEEEGSEPAETEEPADPSARDRASGRRTRIPSRIHVHYVAANGKVTNVVLHGLSTAHLPTCGNASQETIEGVMAPVKVDCTNVEDAATPFLIDHVEHGMGTSVTVHFPGLFHYESVETPAGVATSFTSFVDGSTCSYEGPKVRAPGTEDPCDLDIVFRFDSGKRGERDVGRRL